MAYSTDDLARVCCTFRATLVSIRSTSPHSLSYIYIYQSLVIHFSIFYLPSFDRKCNESPLLSFSSKLFLVYPYIILFPLFLSFYYFAFLNRRIHRFLATINRQINNTIYVSDTRVEKRCCCIIEKEHLDLFNSYGNR